MPEIVEETIYDGVAFQGRVGILKLSEDQLSFQTKDKVSVLAWEKVVKRQVCAASSSNPRNMFKLILKSGNEAIFEMSDRVSLEVVRDDIGERRRLFKKNEELKMAVNRTSVKCGHRESTPYRLVNARRSSDAKSRRAKEAPPSNQSSTLVRHTHPGTLSRSSAPAKTPQAFPTSSDHPRSSTLEKSPQTFSASSNLNQSRSVSSAPAKAAHTLPTSSNYSRASAPAKSQQCFPTSARHSKSSALAKAQQSFPTSSKHSRFSAPAKAPQTVSTSSNLTHSSSFSSVPAKAPHPFSASSILKQYKSFSFAPAKAAQTGPASTKHSRSFSFAPAKAVMIRPASSKHSKSSSPAQAVQTLYLSDDEYSIATRDTAVPPTMAELGGEIEEFWTDLGSGRIYNM